MIIINDKNNDNKMTTKIIMSNKTMALTYLRFKAYVQNTYFEILAEIFCCFSAKICLKKKFKKFFL